MEEMRNAEKKLENLPKYLERAVSAVMGAAVADAATRPLHWIYRNAELELILEDGLEEGIMQPEFWPVNKSPFYSVPTGCRSGYNHILEAGLQATHNSGGDLDLEEYGRVIKAKFGEGTEWQEAYARRKEGYNPGKRTVWTEPVPGPWIHEAVLHFLKEGEGSPDNEDMDGFLLCLPHLVFNAEKEDVIQDCQKIASLLTKHPINLQCAKVQCEILLGAMRTGQVDLDTLDPDQATLVQDVLEAKNVPHTEFVRRVGNNCYLPGSMKGSLHAVLINKTFQDTIRSCIEGGGCNCSRSNFAGSIVAAMRGIKEIPEDWKASTGDYLAILHLATNLAEKLSKAC